MMLALYRLATTLGGPLIRRYLARRLAAGKEDRDRFGERLGRPGRPRPDGALVWMHAASVGEALSMLPLVDRLRATRPRVHVLVTTGTVTSAKLMAERLPAGAFHQYMTVDRRAWVRAFLDHWRPGLVLWAESEFWPNTLAETAARDIPMALINGRVSPRSFQGWRRAPGLIRKLLSGFVICLGQTDADADRLRVLGAPRAKCIGNLKFSAPPLPAETRELKRLATFFGQRPLWFAASTHPGEEEIAAGVHQRLQAAFPTLLTVIAPRHPGRGPEIATRIRSLGLAVGLRSARDPVGPRTQVYVADTLGELGLFFRLAGVVFIGKSLVALGGQNPLEAARLDCAVLHGPHMTNFEDMVRRMKTAGASVEVADEAALAREVGRLLSDGKARMRLADAARAFATAEAGVLDAVLTLLAPYLEALEKDGGGEETNDAGA